MERKKLVIDSRSYVMSTMMRGVDWVEKKKKGGYGKTTVEHFNYYDMPKYLSGGVRAC